MGKLSFNLEDKVFVVTGGSRGIGLEIAGMLLDQEARVVICGRKQDGLDAAAAELNAGRLEDAAAFDAIRRSLAHGTIIASFTIETFSLERLSEITDAQIGERYDEFAAMMRLH